MKCPRIKQTGIEIITAFYENGQLHFREFRLNGYYHREPADGPAYEVWRENGQLISREFRLHGHYHREPADGPAYEVWHENGQFDSRKFYLNGKQVADPAIAAEEAVKKSCAGKTVVVDGVEYELQLKK